MESPELRAVSRMHHLRVGWIGSRGHRDGGVSFPIEVSPQTATDGKRRQRGEGEPEPASAEPQGECPKPRHTETAAEPEEDETRPPGPPRPPDDEADHDSHPDRHGAEEEIDECLHHRRPPH